MSERYHPIFRKIAEMILRRPKGGDYRWHDYKLVQKGVPQGHYFDSEGRKIMDPIKIFKWNNMPKFKSITDLQTFLKKVDYNRWKRCEMDKDFMFHHLDIVKVMYIPEGDWQKKADRIKVILGIMREETQKMVEDMLSKHGVIIEEYINSYYDLFGDELV